MGSPGKAVQVQDIGPKTSWVEGVKSLDIEVGLGLGVIGALLSFVELPSIPVTGKVLFKYKWNPKVGAVISASAGRNANWTLNKRQGEYLDGSHALVMIIRRRRSVKSLNFRLTHGISIQDFPAWRGVDQAYIPRESLIPIRFAESSVS